MTERQFNSFDEVLLFWDKHDFDGMAFRMGKNIFERSPSFSEIANQLRAAPTDESYRVFWEKLADNTMKNSELEKNMFEFGKWTEGYKSTPFLACYYLLEARKRGLLPTPEE